MHHLQDDECFLFQGGKGHDAVEGEATEPPVLKLRHDVEFVQLQINYADWENPAIQSRANYEMARKYGKSVIVMEPVKGGNLANPPEVVQNIFKAAEPEASVASWAIRFAANLDGLITVLSGMSNVEQMKDNLSYMQDFQRLTPEQLTTIRKAQEALNRIPLIPCTNCNYCAKVCPKNIGISASFNAMNLYTLYKNKAGAKQQIVFNVTGSGRLTADQCVKCGKCEQVCPQHIRIREELENIAQTL